MYQQSGSLTRGKMRVVGRGWQWHEASHMLTSCLFCLHVLPACSFIKGPTMTQDPPIICASSPCCPLSQQQTLSMVSFMCPQCSRRCKSLSGLTRHQNSVHRNDPELSVPVTELQRIYHPTLNG